MANIITSIITIYDTYPFDVLNQRYFSTEIEKHNFFESLEPVDIYPSMNYRGGTTIRISNNVKVVQKGNYIRITDGQTRKYIYATVVQNSYVNDNSHEILFEIDWINTLNLNVGNNLNNSIYYSFITQSHRPNRHEQTGMAVEYTPSEMTMTAIESSMFDMKNSYVYLLSGAELNGKYGNEDQPNNKAARGRIYDRLPSGQRIYICEFDKWGDFTDEMYDYPWITNQFSELTLIPHWLVDTSDLVAVSGYSGLYTLKNNGISDNPEVVSLIFRQVELRKKFNLSEDGSDDWLMRSPYCVCRLTDGDQFVDLDPEKFEKNDFKLKVMTTLNKEPSMIVYPENYGYGKDASGDIHDIENIKIGIKYNKFPKLPLTIDNYKLSMSSNAYSRETAVQNEQINSVFGIASSAFGVGISGYNQNMAQQKAEGSSEISRSSALSTATRAVGGNVAVGAINAAKDEWLRQRSENARRADLKTQPNIQVSGTTSYADVIANNRFGIYVQFLRPLDLELENLRKVYALKGVAVPYYTEQPYVKNMDKGDYIQASAMKWKPSIVPADAYTVLSDLFNSGVTFHYTDDISNILNNKRIGSYL